MSTLKQHVITMNNERILIYTVCVNIFRSTRENWEKCRKYRYSREKKFKILFI